MYCEQRWGLSEFNSSLNPELLPFSTPSLPLNRLPVTIALTKNPTPIETQNLLMLPSNTHPPFSPDPHRGSFLCLQLPNHRLNLKQNCQSTSCSYLPLEYAIPLVWFFSSPSQRISTHNGSCLTSYPKLFYNSRHGFSPPGTPHLLQPSI